MSGKQLVKVVQCDQIFAHQLTRYLKVRETLEYICNTLGFLQNKVEFSWKNCVLLFRLGTFQWTVNPIILTDPFSGKLSMDSVFGRYFCVGCSKSYKHKRHLSSHIRYECGKEPSFKCQCCKKMFYQKYTLNAHLRQIHNINSGTWNIIYNFVKSWLWFNSMFISLYSKIFVYSIQFL